MKTERQKIFDLKQAGSESAIATGQTPLWMIPDDIGGTPPVTPWHIDFPLLAAYIIDKQGLKANAGQIVDATGRDVAPEQVKAAIQNEIIANDPLSSRRNVSHDVREAFEALKLRLAITTNETRKIKTNTGSKLSTMTFPDIMFTVDGLLPAGLVLLAAPPKSGKSWMCLDLAISVASGQPFFGHNTRAGSVLYLAMEDTERRIYHRSQQMGVLSMPDRLEFADRQTVDTLTGSLVSQLMEWVKDHQDARLIIIDTLIRVKGGKASTGGTAYDSDSAIFSRLQKFAIDTGVTCLVVTHLRKQGKYEPDDPFEAITGSMGLPGVADAMMLIKGKKFAFDNVANTILIDGRDIERKELSASFNSSLFRWEVFGDTEELKAQQERNQYEINPIVIVIKKALFDNGGQWVATPQEIQSEALKLNLSFPGSSQTIGKMIKLTIQEKLYRYDRISAIPGKNRNGHFYTFTASKKI